jgi:NAD-dependent dihydropyrimidine dehydrogenase PreA subunit
VYAKDTTEGDGDHYGGLHGMLRIVEPNLDECVHCELCVQAGPGEVRVVDAYE